ncbi:MAG: OsmC family protein [Caldilinea sp.]
MTTTRVKWIEGKSFLGVGENGRSAVMSPNDGPGVSPMQMLLLGLGGCTAIDIVDILEKQRQPLEDIELAISGERGEDWPKPWTRIHIHYTLVGAELDLHKVERAIDLSVNKYCGAHATLAGVAEITHDFEIRAAVGSVIAPS